MSNSSVGETPDILKGTEAVGATDPQRAWKISPGPGGNKLKWFLKDNLIAISYSEYPVDLSELKPQYQSDIEAAIQPVGKTFSKTPAGVPAQLWFFYYDMQPGDRIYLYAGSAIRAVGTIVGDYRYADDQSGDKFFHRRDVEWLSTSVIPTNELSSELASRLKLVQTIIPLENSEVQEIESHLWPPHEQESRPWQQTYALLFPAAGLHYTPWQQAVFFTALQTKGFVILSGISGTGKTKIAQALAAALPQPGEGRNVEFLTVRPDWRDSKSLIGYHNPITDRYEQTHFLKFLLCAVDSWKQRDGLAWFVILDEMNLAHVEHYFAELLSVLESGRDRDGWTNEAIQIAVAPGERDALPSRIRLPPNLFIIGTVNLDETTHAFSPKVLDRAFAIEFSDVTFAHYAPGAKAAQAALTDRDRWTLLDALSGAGDFPRIDRAAIAAFLERDERPRHWLETLNQALRPHHMHFGFRVFDEIMAFVDLGLKNGLFAPLAPDGDPLLAAFDAAVLMKVLPKFHGSRSRLEEPLVKVLAWCFNPDEPDRAVIDNCRSINVTPDELEHALRLLPHRLPNTADRAARLLWATNVDGFAAFG